MSIAQSDAVTFRPTAEADLEFVVRIEAEAADEGFVATWTKSKHAEAVADSNLLHLIVDSTKTRKAVGFLILAGIDSHDRSIEFMRIVIGPRNRGFGREAVRLLKRYAFDELGAHRLWLDVKEFNQRARSLYLAEGFLEEGRLRECIKAPAGYESLIVMSMLEADYRASSNPSTVVPHSNMELVRRFYEDMWNHFDKSLFPELLHRDIRFRGSLGHEKQGYEGLGQYVDLIQAAFPDFHNRIIETISEGAKVFARLLYSGTHKSEILGIPPTGKRFAYPGAAVFTISSNRIADVWVLGDVHGLLAQLGR